MPEDKKDYGSDAWRTDCQKADSDRQKLEEAQQSLLDNRDLPSDENPSMSIEAKPRIFMAIFVAVIFMAAIAIVGFYTAFWTPGDTSRQSSPHAIDQTN